MLVASKQKHLYTSLKGQLVAYVVELHMSMHMTCMIGKISGVLTATRKIVVIPGATSVVISENSVHEKIEMSLK